MLKDFDIAFTDKIKAWYPNTIYAATDIVYNVAFNLVDDKSLENALSFPLISIYRPSGFKLNPNQNFAARKRGIILTSDDTTKDRIMARFLVVTLPYQLDIYTKKPEDLDDITEQIMHALNLDQKFMVIQTEEETEENYNEAYDIIYDSGPSEMSEFTDGDRVYHYSLLYNVENARLINFKTTPSIKTIETTIDVEGSDPDNL